MTLGVEFKQKRMFFDRAAVKAHVGAANAAALSKHGAFVRRRARSSLRRRKKPSAPGSPPSVHTDSTVATLKNIWFAYDPQNQSVVVGPLRLNLHSVLWGTGGPGTGGRTLTRGAVPGILESGGMVGVRKVKAADGTWQRIPHGRRRKPERLVPVWKATAAERSASAGTVRLPMRNGRGMADFYRLPNPPSVIVWEKIAPRPFMGPAGRAELANSPSLWSSGKAA